MLDEPSMKPVSAKHCPSCGERYDADVLFCPRDGTPIASSRTPSFSGAERDPYIGVELAGQIRVKHLIGIGSMGRVYRAFQGGIERDVAVKILHRELSGNTELVARFHREAKVASRLVHPNVVQVLMTGTIPSRGDARLGGELYLVMEHLDGISLLSALAAAGAASEGAALPLVRTLHIAVQICDAVGEAHAQGIVHRDLKPENVMLVHRGEDHEYVKVLDFGIARLNWLGKSMATQAGLIFGTAKYISPEGAEGLPVGPPADVYSIATILYQCLAGRAPFEGDSPVALLVQHTHAPPPNLTSIARASYVPGPIANVIMKNLAKKPGERAPDARALGRELLAAARESGLFPEEIASQSTFLHSLREGAVKLASKRRTKALELSPDFASRISSIPAPSAERASAAPPSESAARASTEAEPVPAHGQLASAAAPASAAAFAPVSAPTSAAASAPASAPTTAERPARAAATGFSQPPASTEVSKPLFSSPSDAGTSSTAPVVSRTDPSAPTPEPAWADADRAPLVTAQSTIQGTETTVPSEPRPAPRRGQISRAVAILACVAAALMVAVVFGRKHLGGTAAEPPRDTIEAYLDEARECMRKRAWDAPAEPNVKDVTRRALARWPSDARLLDLRREAAERVITDALGRKYAGDVPGALHLARLALELSPTLSTAQHLAAELETTPASTAVPAGTDPGGIEPPPKVVPRKGGKEPVKPGTDTRRPRPVPGPASPLPPPALPTDPSTPPPASTGPWL